LQGRLRYQNAAEICAVLPRDGRTEGHGRALLTIDDPNRQEALFQEARSKGHSVRTLEAMANPKPRQTVRRKSAQPELDANLLQLAENLQRALGLKVRFKTGSSEQSGCLEIDYYCEADLDQIYNALNI
jgi:ParB family chromosome partitioning protein